MLDSITRELEARLATSATATHARHADALSRAVEHLQLAKSNLNLGDAAADLVAEELRSATHALDVLVGRVDVEAILDHIFASFCIGK